MTVNKLSSTHNFQNILRESTFLVGKNIRMLGIALSNKTDNQSLYANLVSQAKHRALSLSFKKIKSITLLWRVSSIAGLD